MGCEEKRLDLVKQADWSSIQNQMASLFGISLELFNEDGVSLISSGKESPICRLLNKRGQSCDWCCHAGCIDNVKKSIDDGKTLFFKCKAGLSIFAIPVSVRDVRFCLMGGRVYQTLREFHGFIEKSSLKNSLSSEEITSIADELVVCSESSLKAAAEMIELLANTVLRVSSGRSLYKSRYTQAMSLLNIFSNIRESWAEDEILSTLLNGLLLIFNVKTASLMFLNEEMDAFSTRLAVGDAKEGLIEFKIPVNNPCVENVRASKELKVYDFTECGLSSSCSFPDGISKALLFPVFRRELLTGFLGIYNSTLSEEEARAISFLSLQLSLLLENKEMHADIHMYSQSNSKLTSALNAFSSLDLNNIYQDILFHCVEYIDAELASLMMYDDVSKELSIKAIKGMNKKVVELIKIGSGEGIAGRVFESGSGLLVENIDLEKKPLYKNRSRYKTKSFICLPLKTQNKTIGVLNFADKKNGETFTRDEFKALTSLAAYAAIAIERFLLQKQADELRKISITDTLTGLLNRHYFEERLTEEIERGKRHALPISLMIIDIDNFKSINDTYGHPAGDSALRMVGHVLRDVIRAIDVAARYGGEEFAIILPQTSKMDAAYLAERICKKIYNTEFLPNEYLFPMRLTVSIGLATFSEDADDVEELVKNTDIALYSAKATGKNKVVLFEKYRV